METMNQNTVFKLPELNKQCTGCGACVWICPKQAIKMVADEEGFQIPVLDNDRCINCGQCTKVCQIFESLPSVSPIQVMSAYAKDEKERQAGSSGGIIGLLAKKIMARGGIVYGAVFDVRDKQVKHSSTDVYDLQSLLRSKYVQSNLENTFQQVKSALEENREVFFCGTPCQVVGLKKFLKKEYSKLLTADFFCHGVPSPGLFQDMIHDIENDVGVAVKDVVFRDKKHGWRNQYVQFHFLDETTTLEEKSSNYYYYYYFLKNYSLRTSCYYCSLYKKHMADITVADFWNVEKDLDDDKGISLICLNTEKGLETIKQMSSELICREEKFDIELYKHGYSMKNREIFFSLYRKNGISYLKNEFYQKGKKKNERKNDRSRKIYSILHSVKKLFRG